MFTHQTIIFSLLGGVLPAFVWLLFWLREDAKNPEPKGLLIRTFLLGMLAVILVIPFQVTADRAFGHIALITIILWAVLEEVFKFVSAYFGGLSSKEDDEPLDPLVYLITAALGFSALENALFIAAPLIRADILGSIITGNLRFVGASVLHIVSSGAIGIALGLSFYKSRSKKILWGIVGLLFAIIIHTLFNLILMYENQYSSAIAFSAVWVCVIGLILYFEKVKSIRSPLQNFDSSPKKE